MIRKFIEEDSPKVSNILWWIVQLSTDFCVFSCLDSISWVLRLRPWHGFWPQECECISCLLQGLNAENSVEASGNDRAAL